MLHTNLYIVDYYTVNLFSVYLNLCKWGTSMDTYVNLFGMELIDSKRTPIKLTLFIIEFVKSVIHVLYGNGCISRSQDREWFFLQIDYSTLCTSLGKWEIPIPD